MTHNTWIEMGPGFYTAPTGTEEPIPTSSRKKYEYGGNPPVNVFQQCLDGTILFGRKRYTKVKPFEVQDGTILGVTYTIRQSDGTSTRVNSMDELQEQLVCEGLIKSAAPVPCKDTFIDHPTKEEVPTMRASEALRSQMTVIAEAIAAAEEKEALRDAALSREPSDTDPDTKPVIYWDENFGRADGPVYTYVAVKTNGKWYVSGREGVGRTWEEMVDKYHAIRHGEFWMAAKWVHA